MSASDIRCLLAMPGDNAHPLIELGNDVLWRAGFEKRDAVLPTGLEDAFARLPHFPRIGVAGNREIAERQTEIAGPHFGKGEARHGDDLLAFGNTSGLSSLTPSNNSPFG